MARAREQSPVLHRAIIALLWLMAGANIVYFFGLLGSRGDTHPLINVWVALATQWIPVAIFWLVACRTGFTQLAVVLAAAGVTFAAIGDSYYSLAMDADGYLVFPSPADVGYLLFYPLMVAALVTLMRRHLHGVGRLVLLETAVATVGASAVLAVVVGPVISDALAGDTVLDSTISLAYPLFDLILIAVIAGFASVPTMTIGRRWWALITGLGIFAAADIAYALLESSGTYLAGTPLDATWAIGLAFITWWGAGVTPSRTEHSPAPRRGVSVVLPAVAVLAGLAVLVTGTTLHLSELAIVLAALTVGLGAVPIVFRQAMLGRMLAAQEEVVRRLTELDQAKTDMLVTVNHEFRTPLTSINGHVELLLDGSAGEMPPAAMSMLRTIERNGARLQSLIDETFTASRLEDLESLVARSPVDVAGLVSRAVARVEPLATSRDVTLSMEGDGPDVMVDADGAHLERALANLIDNAVKFTAPDGEVMVSAHGSTADREVVIRVRDTGIGIPAADIPRLFTKFFRASNVQSAAIPGVGLGLSISQQIVHAHGGTIAVDSTVAHGTTITVRLPVGLGEDRLPEG